MLYKLNKKLERVEEIEFQNEKELQTLCEENLEEILNLKFIATEFVIGNFRIDTVAYDSETNAFVIIEYKNTKNGSVIDQGYTYLSEMFSHKADFVLEYNSVTDSKFRINDFDWSSSKIIFISPYFTQYQVQSINFKDLPIELWKIKKFSNGTIQFEEIKPISTSASIQDIAPKLEQENKFSKLPVTTYSEEDSLMIANDTINDIYDEIRDFIQELDERIVLKPLKHYIAFKLERKTFISLRVQKNSIIIWLNTNIEMLNDSKGILRDVSNVGHHGCGNIEVKITDRKNIGYIKDIIIEYLGKFK